MVILLSAARYMQEAADRRQHWNVVTTTRRVSFSFNLNKKTHKTGGGIYLIILVREKRS